MKIDIVCARMARNIFLRRTTGQKVPRVARVARNRLPRPDLIGMSEISSVQSLQPIPVMGNLGVGELFRRERGESIYFPALRLQSRVQSCTRDHSDWLPRKRIPRIPSYGRLRATRGCWTSLKVEARQAAFRRRAVATPAR